MIEIHSRNLSAFCDEMGLHQGEQNVKIAVHVIRHCLIAAVVVTRQPLEDDYGCVRIRKYVYCKQATKKLKNKAIQREFVAYFLILCRACFLITKVFASGLLGWNLSNIDSARKFFARARTNCNVFSWYTDRVLA